MREILWFAGFYIVLIDRSVWTLEESSPIGGLLTVFVTFREEKVVTSALMQNRFSSTLFTLILGSFFSLNYLIFYRLIFGFPNTVNVLCLTGDIVVFNFFMFVANFAGGVLTLVPTIFVGVGNINSVAIGDPQTFFYFFGIRIFYFFYACSWTAVRAYLVGWFVRQFSSVYFTLLVFFDA